MVTVMLLGPIVAVLVVLKVALICVGLTRVTPVTVRPFAGATTLTVDPAVKLLPVRTTATGLAAAVVRRKPEAGVIEERIGVPGFTTVKVTGVVVPAGAVTVTFLAVSAAVGGMVKFALMVVSLVTVKVTVMPPPPPPPLTLTAVAPVRLMPVSVTAWVVPLAPVLGMIENNPAGGTVTVKVTALLFPPGAVTVTFLAPAVAEAAMFTVAVSVLSLVTARLVTVKPLPEKLTEVVPVRPDPVRAIVRPVVPRLAEAGAIAVRTGPVIANGKVLLAPPAFTTPTFTLPMAAAPVLVMVKSISVGLTTVTPLTETPVAAGVKTTVEPVTKLVPVRTTGREVPRISDGGAMDVSVGAGGGTTVNVPALVVPAGVVTVTLRALNVALDAMVKVVVTVVAVVASGPTVMPPPDGFTAEASKRFAPVIVTGTTVPCAPLVGEMDAIVPTPLPWNSTAPTSNRFGTAGSGLGLPKKSVERLGTVAVGRVVEFSGT